MTNGRTSRARDPAATAIVDGSGRHSYEELERGVAHLGGVLRRRLRSAAVPAGAGRVAFLVSPDFTYPLVQRSIGRAGAMAVPLSPLHPAAELRAILEDAEPHLVITDDRHGDRLRPVALEGAGSFHSVAELLAGEGTPPEDIPEDDPERPAMMLYTSGTTGRPKGVVLRRRHLSWQTEVLVEAWSWRPADRALLVLPLHHTHGIVNVLGCALAAGATCEMALAFDPRAVWHRLASGEITVLMAVPTIWSQMIEQWESASAAEREAWSAGAGGLRLAVSGSAALPVPVLDRWRAISGHTLLERYGMTEIGMALSNPLHGERRPGTVGKPLPGVETRIVDDAGGVLPTGEAGELEVRGPGVFDNYWRRTQETLQAFHKGWFRTGDEARIEADGVHRILGRRSVDILKCGGYKISALEIEQVLAGHPELAQIAVCGLPDETWGERIAAAVVLHPDRRANETALLDELRTWAGERLAPYKRPTRLKIFDRLPTNTLGKVVKREVVKRFEG
ncbi:MAG: acyl-CoA synthetase [Acidobacteriota bacterium]